MSNRLPIVIADTCVFLAAMNPHEEHHLKSQSLLRKHGKEFTIAFPVLQELELLALEKYEKKTDENPDVLPGKTTWGAKALEWIESQRYVPLELNHSMIRFAGIEWSDTFIKRNDAALLAAAHAIRATTVYTIDTKLIKHAAQRNYRFNVIMPPEASELPLGI